MICYFCLIIDPIYLRLIHHKYVYHKYVYLRILYSGFPLGSYTHKCVVKVTGHGSWSPEL